MNDPDIYLNHAGTSWPKPQVVLEAAREAMSAPPRQWARRFEEAHTAVAEYFGVKQPEQILLTPGCTSSLSVAMSDAFLEPGKRILTSCWEHHALHRPLLKLAAQGIRVDYIPPDSDPKSAQVRNLLDLNWLENELAQADVGWVALTAACNVTGQLLPIRKVIELAHQYGARVMVDAAQVVGWFALDLPGLGADLVAFGGHKGLQAPWGIGGLYVSEQARMECVSAQCEVASHDGRTPSIRPGYCDVGSVDQVALAGLHAAVRWLSGLDITAQLAQARKQVQRIKESLRPIDAIKVLGGGEQDLPTVAFQVAGLSSAQVASHLAQMGLIVGSGLQCSPLTHEALGTAEAGMVRVSVGLMQSDVEIADAVSRFKDVFGEDKLLALRK